MINSKTSQRGGIFVPMLIILLFAFVWTFAVQSQKLPAKAEDLREVVALAEQSPAAKAALVDALKAAPTPSRKQLQEMRSQVNTILLAEISQEATGGTSAAQSQVPQSTADHGSKGADIATTSGDDVKDLSWGHSILRSIFFGLAFFLTCIIALLLAIRIFKHKQNV